MRAARAHFALGCCFAGSAVVWACANGTADVGRIDGGSRPPAQDEPDTGAAPPDDLTVPLPDIPPPSDLEPTEANLKVAFIGDTGTGADFKSVLALIKREDADLVMIQGDLNYALLGRAGTWFDVIDKELTVPYVVAKGNHDVDWAGYGKGLNSRFGGWGIKPDDGDPSTVNYSLVYKGLKLVMVSDSETKPARTAYVQQQLLSDKHAWKICSWHKNQRASNIGPKDDEMGWNIYENCRVAGAIVAQAHSHTYSRSKTLTNDAKQSIDAFCADPFALCVGRGSHFFFDSSVGGQDLRPPETSVVVMPHWASTVTGSFGALFIEFNVGGDPLKAEGYFKSTTDEILDPPPSSGKTRFTITRTP